MEYYSTMKEWNPDICNKNVRIEGHRFEIRKTQKDKYNVLPGIKKLTKQKKKVDLNSE